MPISALLIGCSSFSATIVQAGDAGLGGATQAVPSAASGGGSNAGVFGGTGGTSSTLSAGTLANDYGGTSSTSATGLGGASTGSTLAYCTIDLVMYANSAPNPSDYCQSCQVDVSTSHWVSRPEGAQCDSGKVCHNGTCQSGCWIGASYYAAGIHKPSLSCMTCQSSISISTWTPDAVNCGCDGQFETVDATTGLCVAKMSQISTTKAGVAFGIDVTEVTQGQYDAWLATNPTPPASDDPVCSWNLSFAQQGVGFTGNDAEHHPVVYIDWCDAKAYCLAVGKRLCGAIAGGPNNLSDDATTNQWDCACTACGNRLFPWGEKNDPSYCNGADGSSTQTTAVASRSNCVTATGVFDMIGNVGEWEDYCEGNERSASCDVRGGAIGYDPRGFAYGCAPRYTQPRNTASYAVGFRCCSK